MSVQESVPVVCVYNLARRHAGWASRSPCPAELAHSRADPSRDCLGIRCPGSIQYISCMLDGHPHVFYCSAIDTGIPSLLLYS